MQRVARLGVVLLLTMGVAIGVFWGGSRASATNSTLGTTTVGSTTAKPGANYKFGNVYALSQAGTLNDLKFYAKGAGSTTQSFLAVVYAADGSGKPTDLITQSQPVTIAAKQTAQWVALTLPTVTLQPGNYFIGLLSGNTKGGTYLYYSAGATNADISNADTYPNPTATFGTPSYDNRQWSFYVDYTAQAPAAPVNTVLPQVSGTPNLGATLSVDNGSWNNNPTSYSYQWQRCSSVSCTDIADTTNSTYSVNVADLSATLQAEVTAMNAVGSTTVTSNRVAVASPPANQTLPQISGTAMSGSTLSADTGTWANNPSSYSYQWQRCTSNCVDIGGATASTYVVTDSDVNDVLDVVVTAANDSGSTSATSDTTNTVQPLPAIAPANTTIPTISGDNTTGSTVTATLGTWTGSPTPTYTVQWYDCIDSDDPCAVINGATNTTYTITSGDVGQNLEVVVTAANSAGSVDASSDLFAVPAPSAPVNTVLPSTTGTAQEGQTLTADPGTWLGTPTPSLGLQWQDCINGTCTDIAGATGTTYTIASTDVGDTLDVVVTATNSVGMAQASSAPTAIIAAAATSGTLGETSVGTQIAYPGAGYKFGSEFSLSASATLTDFKFYAAGGSSSQAFEAVIYATDNSGNPTNLMLQSQGVVVAASQTEGWVTIQLPSTDLPPGTYLLGLLSGGTKSQAAIYYASVTNDGYYNSNAYPTASATWGTVQQEAHLWSFYVDYTTTRQLAPQNTSVPTITGTPQVNGTLSASTGSWSGSPTSYGYQWQDCTNGTCTDIAGATTAMYTVAQTDEGSTLRLVVTASNAQGAASATSAETSAVIVPGSFTVETFIKYVIDSSPPGAVVEKTLADLNNDGKLDAVIGTEHKQNTTSGGGIYWYEYPASGNPADTWVRHTIIGSGHDYEDMAPYDLNGDGFMDIIASIDNEQLVWFQNPGTPDGTWKETVIGNGYGENTMRLTDIDGDGKIDVVSSSGIYFQNSPTSWTKVAVGTSFRGAALLDIGSGLGAINLVTNGPAPNYNVVWYENPREHGGNARTDAWTMYTVGPGYTCANCSSGDIATESTGDLNGDGRMDIVVAQSETDNNKQAPPGGLKWYEASADPTQAWTEHTIDSSLQDAHNTQLADIDGNGALDIITGEQDQSAQRRVMVYYNDGNGNFVASAISTGDGTHNVEIGDVEGDGDIDILGGQHGYYHDPNPLSVYINGRF